MSSLYPFAAPKSPKQKEPVLYRLFFTHTSCLPNSARNQNLRRQISDVHGNKQNAGGPGYFVAAVNGSNTTVAASITHMS